MLLNKGEGGLNDENQLFALYVLADQLYFFYNRKAYILDSDNLICTYTKLDKKRYEFFLKSGGEIICHVIYQPYKNPQGWIFDEMLEETFDILFYLYQYLRNKASLLDFINGVERMNQYYQSLIEGEREE